MTHRPPASGTSMLAAVILFAAASGQALRNLLGWWGWGAVAVVLVAAAAWTLVARRRSIRWSRIPLPLLAFLAFALISIAWSAYPSATLLGVVLQLAATVTGLFLGLCLSWSELVTALGRALRWTVGASLLFELVVAVLGSRVLPLWIDAPSGRIPDAYYWSLGELLHGGPIQGIVGNRNLLGFAALLGIIVIVVELAARTVRRRVAIIWIVLFAAALLLTRSATVLLCAACVLIVAAFALWMRRRPDDGRRPVYLAAAAVVALGALAVGVLRGPLLSLLGKSDDATGRLDIWDAVSGLAQQRPVVGWGWVGYWNPWVAPFDHLAERKGVLYLQAHDAWLDVWFQLGVIGVVLLAAFVLPTLWRSWFIAVDRPHAGDGSLAPYRPLALAPLLLLIALLAQSIAESRLLVESGWILLVALGVAAAATRENGDPTAETARAEPRDPALPRRG
jgi:exopolysaccharide production protein ExoQ